jgi:hypothetical protein
LKPANRLEELTSQYFPGELHQTKRAKQGRPTQRGELARQELAEHNAVSIEELANPVLVLLLLIDEVFLLGLGSQGNPATA